jgi:NADPH:quinone reductase-like Zn-dependent oxidoreductase
MRAAVTERAGSMVVCERPEPPPPGRGQVLIRPEAVGMKVVIRNDAGA